MADNPQAMDDLRAILESRTALYAKAGAEVNTADKTQAQAFAALLGRHRQGQGPRAVIRLSGSLHWLRGREAG